MSDVHTEHCCAIHGCKYSKPEECTVLVSAENKEYVQSYICENCDIDGLKSVEDVIKHFHPTYKSFDNHIILYAKNWYGCSATSNENLAESQINDIRKLLARWAWIDEENISDADVQSQVLDAFIDHIENRHDKREGLQEMLGWRWGRNGGALSDRDPITVMLGKLSVTLGKFVYLPDKYEDVCFDRDRGVDCKKCHMSNKGCTAQRVAETA